MKCISLDLAKYLVIKMSSQLFVNSYLSVIYIK